MPHFLNLIHNEDDDGKQPLKFKISEGKPMTGKGIKNIQLTRVEGRTMHAQPALIRFRDGSVSCAFFENGNIINLEQLHPRKQALKLTDVSIQKKIPIEVIRIPLGHIKRHQENFTALEEILKKKQTIDHMFKKQVEAKMEEYTILHAETKKKRKIESDEKGNEKKASHQKKHLKELKHEKPSKKHLIGVEQAVA